MNRGQLTLKKNFLNFTVSWALLFAFRTSDTTENFASSFSVIGHYAYCYLLFACTGFTRHQKYSGWSDSTRRKSVIFIVRLYKRVLSYSLVLSIHISKLFYTDFIGFSLEYGFIGMLEFSTLND
jgi:hypothetical protein